MAANQALIGDTDKLDDTLIDVEGAMSLLNERTDLTAQSFVGLDTNLQQSNSLFATFMQGLQSAGNAVLDFGSSLLKSIGSMFGGGGIGLGGGGFSGLGSVLGALGGTTFAGGAVGGGAFATPLISGASIFASGGYVRKMAAGGMMRDRVPAMLEPGEFVMQRKAVNRIGADNLSAMNG